MNPYTFWFFQGKIIHNLYIFSIFEKHDEMSPEFLYVNK